MSASAGWKLPSSRQKLAPRKPRRSGGWSAR
uniref:Uncharacterized protein n=1 Tax=Arundo donax TaxID=35708 RepID=A0A0A8Y8Y3_ARUDO